MRLVRALVGSASLIAGGCGEGLTAGDAYSNPLFTFSGMIAPAGKLTGAVRPRVGLLWTDPNQVAPDVPSGASQLSSQVDTASDRYTATIFRPPPAATPFVDLVARAGGAARLALGEIVLFDDVDGDGTFSVSGPHAEIGGQDVFLGGAGLVIRYVARPFDSAQFGFPLGTATAAGYALLELNCRGPALDPSSPGSEWPELSNVGLTATTSRTLPELRTCGRSHSP